MQRLLIVSTAFLASAAAVAPAQAQTVYGLVGSDRVVTFSASDPGTITSSRAITGLGANEVLTGIDIRPNDNLIYSVSTTGNVYRLTPSGGGYAATLTGATQGFPPPGPPIAVSGTNFGIDFNPVPDRIRLISNTDQNLRINPLNGGTAIDGAINPSGLNLIGAAYTNSAFGATSTTLFGIDAASALLVSTTAPNAGTYFSIGSLGLGASLAGDSRVGFDILFSSGLNRAFLAFDDNLYSVNLSTGLATEVGGIGVDGVRGITTAVPEPATWAMMIGGFGLAGAAMRRRVRMLPATA